MSWRTSARPANQQALGIQEIFAEASLRNKFNDPTVDPRTPDIILKAQTGVIFTGGSKLSEHGGFNEDDVHTALLVSIPGLDAATVSTATSNQQVAPTILEALGLDPSELKAVQLEQIHTLPGAARRRPAKRLNLSHDPIGTDMEVAAAPGEARGKEGAAPDPADQQVACREQPQIGEQGAFVPEPMHEM